MHRELRNRRAGDHATETRNGNDRAREATLSLPAPHISAVSTHTVSTDHAI